MIKDFSKHPKKTVKKVHLLDNTLENKGVIILDIIKCKRNGSGLLNRNPREYLLLLNLWKKIISTIKIFLKTAWLKLNMDNVES